MSSTEIEWSEVVWNPLAGCSRVSEGCRNCYAETMARRLAGMARKKLDQGEDPKGLRKYLNVLDKNGRWNGTINTDEDALTEPLKRKKPTVYFVNSMSDLFHKDVPFEFIDKVFAVMALTPQHTYQVLTKRPERMAEHLSTNIAHRIYQRVSSWLDDGEQGILGRGWDDAHDLAGTCVSGSIHDFCAWNMPLENCWLGTSVEDQEQADKRIPHLLRCPAAVRWLSMEPLLGPVEIDRDIPAPNWGPGRTARRSWLGSFTGINTVTGKDDFMPGIDWVVVGGESGHGARPCNVEWIRSIIGQCKAADVPCFVKQFGAKPYDPAWHGDGTPDGSAMLLNDKKGGDPSEWPADLRIREYPVSHTAPQS